MPASDDERVGRYSRKADGSIELHINQHEVVQYMLRGAARNLTPEGVRNLRSAVVAKHPDMVEYFDAVVSGSSKFDDDIQAHLKGEFERLQKEYDEQRRERLPMPQYWEGFAAWQMDNKGRLTDSYAARFGAKETPLGPGVETGGPGAGIPR